MDALIRVSLMALVVYVGLPLIVLAAPVAVLAAIGYTWRRAIFLTVRVLWWLLIATLCVYVFGSVLGVI